MSWELLAAIIAGLVAVVALWLVLRSRTPEKQPGPAAEALPPKNLVSRVVSWTSMLARGGYRGPARSLHRAGGSVDVLITDPTHTTPIDAWVHERSVHTLILVAKGAFAVGAIATVRPTKAPDKISAVEVEVLECNPQEGTEWQLVCKFVKIPPYGVLMYFG